MRFIPGCVTARGNLSQSRSYLPRCKSTVPTKRLADATARGAPDPPPSCGSARGPPGFFLHSDFATSDEEIAIAGLADDLLEGRERRGEHYDGVISGYRECFLQDVPDLERLAATQTAAAVVRRMRAFATDTLLRSGHDPTATSGRGEVGTEFFYPHTQIIELAANGRILPHIDNAKLFGEFTCGLNLLSPAVLRFVPLDGTGGKRKTSASCKKEQEQSASRDVMLPPRSCYVMSGDARWRWQHAVLSSAEMESNGSGKEGRGRRLSVIVRDRGPIDPTVDPVWRVVLHTMFPKLPAQWI